MADWVPKLTPLGEKLKAEREAAMASNGAKANYAVDFNQVRNAPAEMSYGASPEANDPGMVSPWRHFTGPDGVRMVAVPLNGGGWQVFPDQGDLSGGWLGNDHEAKLNGVKYDVYNADGSFNRNGAWDVKESGVMGPWGALAVLAMPFAAAAMGAGAAGGAAASAAGEAGAGALAAGSAGASGAASAAAAASELGAAGAGAAGAGAGAAELAAGAGLSFGAPLGAEAVGAAGSLAGAASLESVAAALGMTPEAFGALGAAGTGAAGAAAGQLAGTAAGSAILQNPGLLSQVAQALGTTPAGLTSLLGPAASVAGGLIGANAAGNAADKQQQSVQESNALLERMFDKQNALQEPFRQNGLAAGNRMMEVLGIGGDPNAADYGSAAKNFGEPEPVIAPWTKEAPQWKDFTNADFVKDPGYQFRMDEGAKGVTHGYAGKGSYLSGAGMKALERYGQDYASNEFGKASDRFNTGYTARVNDYNSEYSRYGTERASTLGQYADRYNRYNTNRSATLNPLQSIYGSGQTSANTMTNAAGNYGQNASQNIQAGGNAAAAGSVGTANAWSGALNGAWGSYQQNELMKRLLPTGA